MSDIVAFLRARLDDDERYAGLALPYNGSVVIDITADADTVYAPFDIGAIGLERFLPNPAMVAPVPCGEPECRDLLLVHAGFDLSRVRCAAHRPLRVAEETDLTGHRRRQYEYYRYGPNFGKQSEKPAQRTPPRD